MKRIVGVIAALASLLATSAYAAPPPPPPVYNWTGFYAGANVGYSFGSSSTTQSFNDSVTGALLSASSSRFDMDGVIGGGQAGYNWQRMNWVFGFETDIQGSGQGATRARSAPLVCWSRRRSTVRAPPDISATRPPSTRRACR